MWDLDLKKKSGIWFPGESGIQIVESRTQVTKAELRNQFVMWKSGNQDVEASF